MTLPEPTLRDIMNAINAHDQRFEKMDKRFDDIIEVMQESFAHVDADFRDIRSKMVTKEDLEQSKQELRQEIQETKKELHQELQDVKLELKTDIKQLGHRQKMADRDLETIRLRLKHLQTNP
jgi:cell shape-determining protein MreC